MNRRSFIRKSGASLASLLITDNLYPAFNKQKDHLIDYPDAISAIADDQLINLIGKAKQIWTYRDIVVNLKSSGESILVGINAPGVRLRCVTLKWNLRQLTNTSILNDHWERIYGDVSWHKSKNTEILPWYFMQYDGESTCGFGVKTGAHAFCHWQIDDTSLSLILDTQCGGMGVMLGDRRLNAAEIITIKNQPGESTYQTTRDFVRKMCSKAQLPNQPVYGINDWYFTYGNNSAKLIIEHTELMMPMAADLSNRPFSVIDAGWFNGPPSSPNDCCWGDNMDTPNSKFGDMERLAGKIRSIGMRPAIWTRPLCGSYKDSKSLMLPLIPGREEDKPVLDPSIPENLERIKGYFSLYKKWSYEMVKFDYTTFDILGKWGFEMRQSGSMTASSWNMNDQSKTNTEIILNLYTAIREAAGNIYLIGCNTISHLSAGLFELNRIGDDTSGNEWDRTRKMGVNALAFRGLQHGIFYSADADCVGLTLKVPWEKNKQWMELLAKSGTPLFISAQPEAISSSQKETIKECFKLASQNLPLGEPLDWMENNIPQRWKLNGKIVYFNWD